ncbi:MAG: DUF1080 domain-containing protein [bacterium]
MNRTAKCLINGCWIALLSFPLLAAAVDLCPEEKSQGFELLFNGENLDEWVIQGLEGEQPNIEDGMLKMDGWDWWAIISKKKFKNFTLRCDVMIEPKGNTGILFHTPEKEVFITSPEVQLRDDAGTEPSKECSGALFNGNPPKKNTIKTAGEWNTVEITVKDNHLTVILNGETVQDVGLDSVSGIKHKQQEGGIALQHKSFKHKAAFRNIRVKSL